MRYVFCFILALLPGLRGIAQAPPSPAPAALNLQAATETLMAEALRLFQGAKYEEALANIAEVKKNLENKPFPQVLFVEGASHFNLNQYAKAIVALEEYVKNFPEGEYINPVRMALGRSYINQGQADTGIAILKDVVNRSPDLKAEAGLFIAEALKKQNKITQALTVLKSVISGGLRSPESIQAAMMAADLHVAKGELDEAAVLMDTVKGYATGGDNVAQMNNIYLKLGDQMLEKKSFREALSFYQLVRRKSEITRLQNDTIAKIEQSLKNPGQGPVKGTQEELQEKLAFNRSLLADIARNTDYDAALYYRLGRCYFEMGRFWESLLAFDVIVKDFKDFPQRDRCVFGMIIANSKLQRIQTAHELCERYIREFPEGEELGTVSEMYGMLAYDHGKLQEAADAFKKAEGFPQADKQRLRFLRGNVLFEMQRFDDARTVFEDLITEFPDSIYKDDALYRVALVRFYQGKSGETIQALNHYMKENPKGLYLVDARYRLAFIKYQDREVDAAMSDLQTIIQDAPDDPNIGQVHTLLGDAFNQKGDYEKALEHFVIGVAKARTDDVRAYAMDQATELYSATGKWKELGDMWSQHLATHKDNEEQELKAILWISRARIKEGKMDEARTLLADAIRPKISNPANQQVEGLLQQLVNLTAPKRRRPATADEPGAEPPPTFDQVALQLEQMITPPPAAMNGTVQMRILFARAWLAKVMRDPIQAEKIFSVLVDVASPEDLSPMLLATVGDNARSNGDFDKASGCYNRLNQFFKDTEYADGAAVGLAEISAAKGDHEKALELFSAAIEEYASSSRLMEATLGKANSLFHLKKYTEAKKLYEQILNTREWRGEAHAMSLFMQGEIEFANEKWGQAIPFYQRVFIAHQKWKPLMAKAYLQCARAFLKRNGPPSPPENPFPDRETAKLVLQEMLKRADLKDQTEMKQATQELSRL